MNSKRVSFDLMNLGRPVHTDPFEMDHRDSQETGLTETYINTLLPDKLLREKLVEEARKYHTDFFVRDPSSSDESDDYAFPETVNEQVRRLSFAKRRRFHYTEFATVELARRLICDEFASESSSLKSEDSAFRSEKVEEECSPCWVQSTESYPFLQYERNTGLSQGSDESALKEDPEPGFDPSHPCYRKLVGQLSWPASPKKEATPTANELITAVQSLSAFLQPRDVSHLKNTATDVKDLQETLDRHTRVLDKGGKWD
ncbi:hypothetical protein KR200_000614, partial [Drosophila serrata]